MGECHRQETEILALDFSKLFGLGSHGSTQGVDSGFESKGAFVVVVENLQFGWVVHCGGDCE